MGKWDEQLQPGAVLGGFGPWCLCATRRERRLNIELEAAGSPCACLLPCLLPSIMLAPKAGVVWLNNAGSSPAASP